MNSTTTALLAWDLKRVFCISSADYNCKLGQFVKIGRILVFSFESLWRETRNEEVDVSLGLSIQRIWKVDVERPTTYT